MARRTQMPVFSKDDSKEQLITLEFKDGAPLVIITMRAEGITVPMMDWYQNDVYTHCSKIDKANQMTLKETHDDHKIVH